MIFFIPYCQFFELALQGTLCIDQLLTQRFVDSDQIHLRPFKGFQFLVERSPLFFKVSGTFQ